MVPVNGVESMNPIHHRHGGGGFLRNFLGKQTENRRNESESDSYNDDA